MGYTTPSHSRQHSTATNTDSPTAASSPQSHRRPSTQDAGTPLRASCHGPSSSDVFDGGVFSSPRASTGGISVGLGASIGTGGGDDGGGGLGNLADELADAFSDDDDEGIYDDEGAYDDQERGEEVDGERDVPDVRLEAGLGENDGPPSPGAAKAVNNSGMLNPPSPGRRGHKRAGSEYDGSEYGSDSDLESAGLPPSLVAKMDAVESLARRGTETTGGPADGVFERVVEALKDLGSQAGVEGNATRYTHTPPQSAQC